jgi:hypothetical protein
MTAPARKYWRWSHAELVKLALLRGDGRSWEEIAAELRRTVSAVMQAPVLAVNVTEPAMAAETCDQAAAWSGTRFDDDRDARRPEARLRIRAPELTSGCGSAAEMCVANL